MFLNLRIAVKSLAVHKLRAALAMLGVFLGALAFSGVQHVSQALERKAELEAEKMGPSLFAAVAGQVRFSRSGAMRLGQAKRNFTEADARALADGVPSVLSMTPYATASLTLRSDQAATTATVIAAWPEYSEIRDYHAEYGRFVTRADEEAMARVLVLGRDIAERLFTRPEAALGRVVYVGSADYRVVGVMEKKGRDLAGDNQDEQAFLPLSTYLRRVANQDFVSGAFLRLAPGANQGPALTAVEDAARAILRSRHHLKPGQADDFTLLTARQAQELQFQALELVHTLGLIASSVCFGVGGMGILSIMILMVRARRLEIGIRRAVGGKRSQILGQFLLESGLMAGTGGTLGVLSSLGLTTAVSLLGDMPFVLDPLLLAGTLAASAAIGLLAGSYPAWQAARVDILDVLRL
jgi:putative ABC transport system permease protein